MKSIVYKNYFELNYVKILISEDSLGSEFEPDLSLDEPCEHGRRKGGQGGQGPPWILKSLAKKGCFFQFRGVNNKFHRFWTPLEKFLGKSPTVPPWKKSFRRPCL